MVISEALARRLPVIVHQADGTEYDLVRDGETGIRPTAGEVADFRGAIESLARDPERAARMGEAGRRLAEEEATLDAMVEHIVEACRLALQKRSGQSLRPERVATPSS
jgi:glycosyltransferase involved in cell wall biosynthesis